MNDGSKKFTNAGYFDMWMASIIDYFEGFGVDRDSSQAIKNVGHFVTGRPKELWTEARNKLWTMGQYFVELRQHCIRSTYRDDLYDEFDKISQIKKGRTRPITEVAQDLRIIRTRIPWITKQQMFHQFKKAMEPELRARVGPFLDEKMKWNDVVRQAEQFDAELY